MKWTQKGHELDLFAEKFLKENAGNQYHIFGVGLLGKKMSITLRAYGCMGIFIDNDIKKQKNKIDGIDVVSLSDYMALHTSNGKIVVAVSEKNSHEIVEQLESIDLKQGVDFWTYNQFNNYVFPIISTYYYNKSYISLAQITLTERCSLKCKKCAHGCFAVDSKDIKDLTMNQVFKSADSFFSKVDYIQEFVLLGGEPLLYKKLAQVIDYIGKYYQNHMGIYSITTNGTIIPNMDILEVCKKYNVLFRISNYIQQIPSLKDSHKQLIIMLEKYGISYILEKPDREWWDYGFDYLDRKGTEEQLIKVFDSCRTPCREIRENRFYYCVMARSNSENLKYNVGKDDYLDLDELKRTDYKKVLLEFTLGYSEKGYLDMCNYCNGADAKNHLIPAAEQKRSIDKDLRVKSSM